MIRAIVVMIFWSTIILVEAAVVMLLAVQAM